MTSGEQRRQDGENSQPLGAGTPKAATSAGSDIAQFASAIGWIVPLLVVAFLAAGVFFIGALRGLGYAHPSEDELLQQARFGANITRERAQPR